MNGKFLAGAVIYAKDIQRVSQFYCELAELPITHQEPDYVVLESPNFQLTVVAAAPTIADKITISSPPERRENTAIKLCFPVMSLVVARKIAVQLGGKLNDPEREWLFQGSKVCDAADPEGNIFQVRVSEF
ncbi:VOC family protein [Balneatrix alpica]|uniref:VOC family protein n=1 Tax=Balneatrix alpica TaxID=75684 RepID=A0ABV5ZFN8_9GAMM|nr:VOC family protein [Balneatrix alpica]